MKLSYFQINKVLIYFIIVLLSVRLTPVTMFFSLFSTVILWIWYFYFPRSSKSLIANISIWLLIGLFVINLIKMIFLGQYQDLTLKEIIFNYGGFLLILLAYPTSEILKVDKKNFLNNINRLGISIIILKILSWILYNFMHLDIGFSLLAGRIDWTRSIGGKSLSRINGTFLDGFLFAYAFSKVLSSKEGKNKKILYLAELILLIGYSYFIFQSRAQLTFYVVCLVIGLLYWGWNKQYKLFSFFLMIILLISIAYIFKGAIDNFIGSFSINSEHGRSTLIRFNEYDFFKNLWVSDKLLGFGFSIDNMGIYQGDYMYRSDMGILMQLYQFGIIGLIISLLPFVIGIIKSIKELRKKNNTYSLFFFIFNVYLIISFINFDVYMYNLIPIMFIYLAMILEKDRLNESNKELFI